MRCGARSRINVPTASDGGLVYLDASALVKVLVEEKESAALRAWIADAPDRLSSVVTAVELRRAARRAAESASPGDASELERQTEIALSGLQLLALDDQIAKRAAAIDPPALRSLDAIHLATALSIDELQHFVTYDVRLADAASEAGLAVAMPGLR